ncbi:hypothetical protein LX15_001391 [Streptoalloteichus tenebrarius]|uniref:Peptide chain release factor 1 n=1 Tax=Streptoalloteichus tenebrarius (strain ATCC 17920 / DSM 40477 / JCM 4838 / CBS 697.72 / NBRC 16177 / NCIMB 11028 / NRRL B-12390 / A12253. 1 / ISP 5477) TaxID=1933 RepID=A0ABT1HQG7_STRSD|nr:Vms1/Ankzf1 family peptidyl-tRNA hydrolase [Streptoalloteichus tenebrarius]MCP2257705.1 hypothetical protein [Streptoalloteichus tenebrarius]BFE99941.1 Vms1/Ankzf1 family peptidyl-tRNA hydrolase [Streptoalloteichus tenebrarius]
MDFAALTEVVRRPGPFASVYYDASHDTEDAEHAIELRWRDLRGQLAEQGADEDTLRALDLAADTGIPAVGRAGRALVATGGEVVLDAELPDPPVRQEARFGPLPHLMPLLAQMPPTVPHVVVVVDRVGAEIRGYRVVGESVMSREVRGEEHPAHKGGDGGWSHRKMQQRVENLAEHNAARIAGDVDRMVRDMGARLLVVAGEVQARKAVCARLSPACRAIAVEAEAGGLAEGMDPEALATEVRRLVAERVDREQAESMDRFVAESGRARSGATGRAVATLREVASALRDGQVDTLLLLGDATEDRELWVGPEPAQVAVDESELRERGVSRPVRDRADAALLRAALDTGATVRVVTEDRPELPEGVGALLRYATAPAGAGTGGGRRAPRQ